MADKASSGLKDFPSSKFPCEWSNDLSSSYRVIEGVGAIIYINIGNIGRLTDPGLGLVSLSSCSN